MAVVMEINATNVATIAAASVIESAVKPKNQLTSDTKNYALPSISSFCTYNKSSFIIGCVGAHTQEMILMTTHSLVRLGVSSPTSLRSGGQQV